MVRKQKKQLVEIKQVLEDRLVDICAGPMKLEEVSNELKRTMLAKSPEYLVILIEKRRDLQKYYSTLYITKSDFENPYSSLIKYTKEVKK
jgi:hypothetical protein